MRKIFIKIIFLSSVLLFLPFFTKAVMLGDQRSFNVTSSYDAFGRASITATLQEISEHAYFYTEDDWWNGLGVLNGAQLAIHNLSVDFDQNIYPKLTKVYGPPWEPGIDNDSKITILISKQKEGTGGYFNSGDEYPRSQSSLSNEREMIYLNSLYYDSSRAKSFLAHEFQHLITFYQKEKLRGVMDDAWLNEARSEYASTLAGFDSVFLGSNLEKRVFDFLKNPSDSLTEWTGDPVDYGLANLFLQYFVGYFGEGILSKMVQSPYVGIASVNEALKSSGSKETFANMFINWSIANYINDCRIEGQKFCYLNASLNERIKILPSVTRILPQETPFLSTLSDSIKDWSGHWYKFIGGDSNLKIDFNGRNNPNFKVAYITEKTDGFNEVRFINLDNSGEGIGFVLNFGSEAKSLVLVPVSEFKSSDFSGANIGHPFDYKISLTTDNYSSIYKNSSASVTPNYPNGSLIRAKGDTRVYVIRNGFKRWIQSSEIFNFYPHFKWQSVIEVTNQERDWYKDAWLVRVEGEARVWEINGDGTKHWLNMTAEQFASSGRQWEMVFIVNKAERDWYKTGASILK